MKPEEFENIYLKDYFNKHPIVEKKLLELKCKSYFFKKGFSLFMLAIANEQYYGMFIILLAKSQKPTAYHNNFIKHMRERGYHADFYFGFLNAKIAIEKYLDESRKQKK